MPYIPIGLLRLYTYVTNSYKAKVIQKNLTVMSTIHNILYLCWKPKIMPSDWTVVVRPICPIYKKEVGKIVRATEGYVF